MLACLAAWEDHRGMATLPNSEELWTVREYLRTSWSPDREFVDGRIEERPPGLYLNGTSTSA